MKCKGILYEPDLERWSCIVCNDTNGQRIGSVIKCNKCHTQFVYALHPEIYTENELTPTVIMPLSCDTCTHYKQGICLRRHV